MNYKIILNYFYPYLDKYLAIYGQHYIYGLDKLHFTNPLYIT